MRIVVLLLVVFVLSCNPGMSNADKAEIKRLEWARDSMLYRLDSLSHDLTGSAKNRQLISKLEIEISFNKLKISTIKAKYD